MLDEINLWKEFHRESLPPVLKRRGGWGRKYGSSYLKYVHTPDDVRDFNNVLDVSYAELFTRSHWRHGKENDLNRFLDEFRLQADFPQTSRSFVVYDHHVQPVGTIRLELDHAEGLPLEHDCNFSLNEKRGASGLLGEIGRLSILSKYRHSSTVLPVLLSGVFYECLFEKVHLALAQAWEPAFPLYEKLGFEKISEEVRLDYLGLKNIMCELDIAAFIRSKVNGLGEQIESTHLRFLRHTINEFMNASFMKTSQNSTNCPEFAKKCSNS